jgi:hypothetical protein
MNYHGHWDSQADLENYVRLSFGANNPMMYQAVAEKRISQPVMLKIKIRSSFSAWCALL